MLVPKPQQIFEASELKDLRSHIAYLRLNFTTNESIVFTYNPEQETWFSPKQLVTYDVEFSGVTSQTIYDIEADVDIDKNPGSFIDLAPVWYHGFDVYWSLLVRAENTTPSVVEQLRMAPELQTSNEADVDAGYMLLDDEEFIVDVDPSSTRVQNFPDRICVFRDFDRVSGPPEDPLFTRQFPRVWIRTTDGNEMNLRNLNWYMRFGKAVF